MTDKEKYRDWCNEQADIPVFMQPWWLDAVCAGKEWDVMLWEEADVESNLNAAEDLPEQVQVSHIVAAMPYLIRKRYRIRYVLMPQQTQTGGVWIREDKRSDTALQTRIADDIVERLHAMKLSYYYQQFPIDSPFPEMLRERGFRIKQRVSYRIEDLEDLDKVMNSFSKNKRRQLQKALTMSVDEEMEVEDFYRFHTACLQQQGKTITYTREFLLVLYMKASRLGQCRIVRIKTANGETSAAAFVVWDKKSLYYLIPCYSPEFKDSGAGALLVWESIKLARRLGLEFDFEGSMIRGVANHYKQFGSVPAIYYGVRKSYNPLFSLYIRLRG